VHQKTKMIWNHEKNIMLKSALLKSLMKFFLELLLKMQDKECEFPVHLLDISWIQDKGAAGLKR